jgi:hypothetical protein
MGVPQMAQKRAPSRFSVPQLGQSGLLIGCTPHAAQNLASF